jgi:hypothetical protein
MTDRDAIRHFLRSHQATPVGVTPTRPNLPLEAEEAVATGGQNFSVERPISEWRPLPLSEAPAAAGEYPERFIDGSHTSRPVLCLRSRHGYPLPLLLAEVGAVALRLYGRQFKREFVAVERVLGLVADPLPWEQVEMFAAALANIPELQVRVLPARMPNPDRFSLFDYEANRSQAYNRCQNEMFKLEALALGAVPDVPTLVDGQLGGRIGERAAAARPLLIGAVKAPHPPAFPPAGHNTLLDLKPGQRTPFYQDRRVTDDRLTDIPLGSWFLRLAGGSQLAPNWGVVRIDIPWVQLTRYPEGEQRTGFVNRLSRWLIDARCRTDSYARMPVSLDPIVRAEDVLKPLFTPTAVLVNRLYRTAGLFRGNEG